MSRDNLGAKCPKLRLNICFPSSCQCAVASQAIRRDNTGGEGRLIKGVLRKAVVDYVYYHSNEDTGQSSLGKDAEDWLRDIDTSWPFSFMSVCSALNLDPAYVRKCIVDAKALPDSSTSRKIKDSGGS